MNATQSVAVLGAGEMGSALAKALISAGHAVHVWNRTPQRCAPLREAGAVVAGSVVDAVTAADTVLVCLRDYRASNSVLKAKPVAKALRGKTLVQLTTGTPGEAQALGDWATGQGVRHLDGAIMAYPRGIGSEGCLILYAGPGAVFDDCRPLLVGLGGNPMHLGEQFGLASVLDMAALSLHNAVIQVCSDPGEIGRLRDVDLAIAADPAETLDAVTAAAGDEGFGDYGAWPARAAGARRLLHAAYPEREGPAGVHPHHAATAVAETVGTEAIWTLDGGEAASWAAGAIAVSGPGRVLTHGYLGCLGTGLGYAIGAQIAHPERRVIHVTGDGSMGFHIQELDTIARHGLPIVTVVLNNQVWGMCLHGQQIMYGENYNVITKLGGTCYADVAAAFGCVSERVTSYDAIAPAMARALASGRPAFVEIMTDAAAIHPITLSMLGKVPEGAGEVQIPYYENVPSPAG
jgi:hypothetical protein